MKKSNYKFAAAALAVLLVLMCLLVLPLCHARGIQNKRAVGGVEQTDFSQQGSAPSAEMQQNELAMQLYRNRQSFSEKNQKRQDSIDPPESCEEYIAELKPCYDAAVQGIAPALAPDSWYWLYNGMAHQTAPGGNWMGAEFRSAVRDADGEGVETLNMAREGKTGKFVYITYTFTADDAACTDSARVPKQNDAQSIAGQYLEYLGFAGADFAPVEETELTEYYRTLRPQESSWCALYSKKYQLYLFCTLTAENAGEEAPFRSLLALGVCSLNEAELQQVLHGGASMASGTDFSFGKEQPAEGYRVLYDGSYASLLSDYWCGTSAGAYGIIKKPDNTGSVMVYADKASAVLRVLCSDPECGHASPDCPAFYPPEEVDIPFVQGGKLYVLQYTENHGVLKLKELGLDGQKARTLLELSVQQLWPEDAGRMQNSGLYADFTAALYDGKQLVIGTFLDDYPRAHGTLVEIDVQTGEWRRNDAPAQAMQQQNGAVFYHLVGGWGEYLLVMDGYDRRHVLKADGSVDQMLTSKTYLNGKVFSEWYTVPSGLYAIQDPSDTLYRYNVEKKQMEPMGAIAGAESAGYRSLTGDVLGNVIVRENLTEAQDMAAYWFIPQQPGEISRLTLQSDLYTSFYGYNIVMPLKTRALVGSDTLLVSLRSEETSRFSMDRYGRINDKRLYATQYALITKEDYLNGVPNYRLIENT